MRFLFGRVESQIADTLYADKCLEPKTLVPLFSSVWNNYTMYRYLFLPLENNSPWRTILTHPNEHMHSLCGELDQNVRCRFSRVLPRSEH